MSETIELTVQPRTVTGKDSKKLRRQGVLPGILYGYSIEPQPVQIDGRTFERVYHRAGNVHLVDVRVGETGPATRAFISAVKRDPVTHALIHVDFMAVNLRQETTANVAIVLTGEAPAARAGDGLLLQNLETLAIKVLPTEVPERIEADVTNLEEVGATILVKDLPIPAGVTVLTDPEEVVARISAVAVEPVEEVAATEAAEEEAAESGEAAAEAEEEAEG
ncbi:MAG TPA: 50S ribosomal protein L25 [Chloroflexia bacterium]